MTGRLRRAGTSLALITTLAILVPAAPAGAAPKNACKLVKAGQIEKIFDQPVEKGKKGLKTAVSVTCEFTVEATGDRPEGGVYTFLQFVGAEEAFEVNEEELSDEPISGLGDDAFFQDDGLGAGGVVWVIEGDVLMTVQGVFLSIGTDLEADPAELKANLIEVAKIAAKKL